jgi:hypothetical protein
MSLEECRDIASECRLVIRIRNMELHDERSQSLQVPIAVTIQLLGPIVYAH